MSTVRAAVLTNYFEVAAHLGLNPQRLLSKVNLSRKLLTDPEQRIPLTAAISLLEESARVSGCRTFGLQMAQSRQLGDFGVVSLLLTHQRTLRDALQVLSQYRHLLDEFLLIHTEDAGKVVVLREEVIADFPASRQGTELAIGMLFHLCTALLGLRWRPHCVSFTHKPPADLQLHRRMFKCKVEFDAQFNGIVCPEADLDRPNPLADPNMARYAARFMDSLPCPRASSIVLNVRKAVHVGLPMGRATIEQIARALGMNVRTVQRRLEDSGHTFSELINEVRRELVLRYMETSRYPLHRIAELLGYSMLSSFTRWFKTQFGVAPVVWRVNRGAAPPTRKLHHV